MTTKKKADPVAAEKIDGAWLRRWRERTGLTADQAAEKLGFAHRNSIVKFESGERTGLTAALLQRRADCPPSRGGAR